MQTKYSTIGFAFIQQGVGECAIGFEAFYALKHIYTCKLIIFAHPTMQNLLRFCDFVDEIQPLELESINHAKCDYLILSNAKSYHISFVLRTNAKHIICATKFLSFLSLRCRSVPIYTFKKYKKLDERQILLSYVRRIQKKRYDRLINTIDLSQAKIGFSQEHKNIVQNFFNNHVAPTDYVIMINPFNNSCPYSLTLSGYIQLIIAIAQLPNCIPLVVTFGTMHTLFLETLAKFCQSNVEQISTAIRIYNVHSGKSTPIFSPPPPIPESSHTSKNSLIGALISKLMIFYNDTDLLNLVALIAHTSCVISPSTGTIHLACNQRVPTIALYPEYDTRRWATHNKRYIFLTTPYQNIKPEQEKQLINQTLSMLKQMLDQNEIAPFDRILQNKT